MQGSIFRKKNLDAMASPENIDQYIHVASPGRWLILGAVLLILIGIVIWGIFGTIESTVAAAVLVEDKTAVCTLSSSDMEKVMIGMPVRVDETEGTVWDVESDDGTVTIRIDLPDGAYNAVIVTETIPPLSLLFD